MYLWEIVQKMTEEIETYGSCDMRVAREMWWAEAPTQYMRLIKRKRAIVFLDGEEIFDFPADLERSGSQGLVHPASAACPDCTGCFFYGRHVFAPLGWAAK